MNVQTKVKLALKQLIGKMPKVFVQHHAPYKVFGSKYGGWPILDGSIGSESVVYAFGIGEDISFDTAIINQFGCKVYAFDPTPKVHEWLSNQSLPTNFIAHPWGLSDEDGVIRLFTPKNPDHISHSINPGDETITEYIDVPSKRFSSIMRSLGHQRVDVLKMDIEGFEYRVIDDLLTCETLPKQILIEFHHLMYGISMDESAQAIKKMNDAGYNVFYISETGREFGFVKQN